MGIKSIKQDRAYRRDYHTTDYFYIGYIKNDIAYCARKEKSTKWIGIKHSIHYFSGYIADQMSHTKLSPNQLSLAKRVIISIVFDE